MVAVNSSKISRVPLYLGTLLETMCFRLRGYHPVSPDFPDCSTNTLFGNSMLEGSSNGRSHDTTNATPAAYTLMVWAVPISLAATAGITIVFFSSRY